MLIILLAIVVAACAPDDDELVAGGSTRATSTSIPLTTANTPSTASDTAATSTTSPVTTAPTTATTTTSAPATTLPPTTTLPEGVTPPPGWLGTRVLPTGDNGLGEIQPTPPELHDRRFITEDFVPPPRDASFHADISEVPIEVLERSTWAEGCPVAAEDLAYVTVSFFGFDGRPHTGELLVDATVAENLVFVFERLYEERFPIEKMVITSPEDLDAPPTGDGNVTSAFACRPVVGEDSGWSQHALGTAIDINPFHNPYVKDELVIPELASAYVDRDRGLPGMIVAGDVVTDAFSGIGWTWGGSWNSLKDYQHFSLSGG